MSSAMVDVTPDGIAAVLADMCRKFTDEVVEQVEEGLEQIAAECKDEVKALSPAPANRRKRTGRRYRNGWTVTPKRTSGKFVFAIHNKEAHLVHLLELGHSLRDGTGRKYGEVQPKVHVETARNHADEKVDKLLKKLGG
ncbi:MAG: HK97 gp10 family phage protein [Ruminococcus sp.]|nr:HK97 gp10 family phage protein [Ruminococcus sp.]